MVGTTADKVVTDIVKHQADIARDSVNVLSEQISEIPDKMHEIMTYGGFFYG